MVAVSKALVACVGDAAWRAPARSGLNIPDNFLALADEVIE
jgi:hypothetical protein